MGDSSDYDDENFDAEYHSDDDDDDYDSNGSLDSIDDSDLEYTESESTTDSYVYPWPTSSDDSWADISSDEVIQKILIKLPGYPNDPDKGDDNDEQKGYIDRDDLREFLSEHSDSFVERNDELLQDLQERAAKYHNTKGITETDYQQFMNDVDLEELDDMDEEFLLDRYPMAMESQVDGDKFIPDLYLAKIELYQMYLEYEDSREEYDGDTSEAADYNTSNATMIFKDDQQIDERIEAMNKKEDEQPESAKKIEETTTSQGQSQADHEPPEEETATETQTEPTITGSTAPEDEIDDDRKELEPKPTKEPEPEPEPTKLSIFMILRFCDFAKSITECVDHNVYLCDDYNLREEPEPEPEDVVAGQEEPVDEPVQESSEERTKDKKQTTFNQMIQKMMRPRNLGKNQKSQNQNQKEIANPKQLRRNQIRRRIKNQGNQTKLIKLILSQRVKVRNQIIYHR